MTLKELLAKLGAELDAAAVIRNTADTERRDLTDAEKAEQKAIHGRAQTLRKQIDEIRADAKMADDIRQLAADLGLTTGDPDYSTLGGSPGDLVPGTASRPYRPTMTQSWGKAVADAVAGDPNAAKAPPLGPNDPLPVALPAPRLVQMGTPVMWTRDLLPAAEASGGRYRYMRQTRRGWAAAPTAPGQSKPVSDPGLEWREGRVTIVPTLSEPINRFDVIDSGATLSNFINGNLMDSVEFGIDDAVMNGTVDATIPGTWDGLLVDNTLRDLPFDPAVSLLDAIRLGMNMIGRAPEWYPTTGIVVSDDIWTQLELLKNDVGDYLLDGPAHDRAARRLWSTPVVVSPSLDQETAVVGDFAGSIAMFVADRGNVHLSFSEHHADNFARNLITFRAEARVSVAYLSPRAFCRVHLSAASIPPPPAPPLAQTMPAPAKK